MSVLRDNEFRILSKFRMGLTLLGMENDKNMNDMINYYLTLKLSTSKKEWGRAREDVLKAMISRPLMLQGQQMSRDSQKKGGFWDRILRREQNKWR